MDHPAPTPRSGPTSVRPLPSARAVCLHCATALDANTKGDFCCVGCRAVHGALVAAGLTRYYALRPDAGVPIGDASPHRGPRSWLSPLQERVDNADGSVCLEVDLQGMRCAACVWLVEQLFAREPGAAHIGVNPGTGRLLLQVARDFPLSAFVDRLEAFGYQVGPATTTEAREQERDSRDVLLLRAGLATLCALNAMFFAAAIYFGLEQGPLYRLLHGLNFACASLAVLLGAPVFLGGAVRALRLGILHLDLPIAFGIALSYAAAAWSFFAGQDASAYYDSLAVFIALMLWGRYLQDRMVAGNRARLLSDQGLTGLRARRLEAGGLREVSADALNKGDHLVVPVGEMLLVDAMLEHEAAQFALDSIDGEAAPRTFARGQRVPAGAVNVGASSLHLCACQPFRESAAVELLRSAHPERGPADGAPTRTLARFSGAYVLAVVTAAVSGFALSLARGEALAQAIGVATAVCVVTCPCSIGIALPLARELVHAKLRRLGLFVRDPSFLQRARGVRRLCFDKTGTLTDGHLHVVDPEPLRRLDRESRKVLLSMVSHSNHPRSRAVERALFEGDTAEPVLLLDCEVQEHAGQGLSCHVRGHDYRLGSPRYALGREETDAALCFARDGQPLARLVLTERTRPAARAELARLRAAGYTLTVLSGDAPEHVARVAGELGLPAEATHARMRPEDKARFIADHDPKHSLMLGDGINDNLALEQAACSGTPALARTSVCARSDFYFTSAGLGPLTAALRAAQDLHRIAVRNWVFLASYNTFAVAIAVSGLMKPLWAAVIMPLSSSLSIALTASTLHRWSRTWKS